MISILAGMDKHRLDASLEKMSKEMQSILRQIVRRQANLGIRKLIQRVSVSMTMEKVATEAHGMRSVE